MTIYKKTIPMYEINLTPDEIDTLMRADDILTQFQDIASEDHDIMSLTTGEIIDYENLSVARGIIGGIADNNKWQEIV